MADDVKSRILGLAESLLDDNDTIPAPYRPIVKGLMKNYLKKANVGQISELLENVRDTIIPFVLTGSIPNDSNTNKE